MVGGRACFASISASLLPSIPVPVVILDLMAGCVNILQCDSMRKTKTMDGIEMGIDRMAGWVVGMTWMDHRKAEGEELSDGIDQCVNNISMHFKRAKYDKGFFLHRLTQRLGELN